MKPLGTVVSRQEKSNWLMLKSIVMKTKRSNNSLAFNKAAVTELNDLESLAIVGGTEDMPVPTVIQNLTRISFITIR